MRPEILFALLSMGLLGTNDFLYKWAHGGPLRAGPFMLLQNLAFLPTAAALALYRQELSWHPGLAYGFLNGVLAFSAFLFLLLTLRRGEAIALVPVVRLNFAVTAALTITFLGEGLNLPKGAGLALAGAAVLAGGAGVFSGGGDWRAIALAVSSMCAFGFIGLFYKLGLGAGASPSAMVLAQSVGVFSCAVPFKLLSGEPFPRRGVALWTPLICGMLTSGSYVSLSVAFLYGEAVVVAPIAQLSFVLTGLLAVLFLGERLSGRKRMSFLFALASVGLFAWA